MEGWLASLGPRNAALVIGGIVLGVMWLILVEAFEIFDRNLFLALVIVVLLLMWMHLPA